MLKSRSISTATRLFRIWTVATGCFLAAGSVHASWNRVDAVVELLNGAEPQTGRIQLELPGVTQDGSSVPLSVQVDHPMTEENYVSEIHVFADGNPSPELIQLRLTPMVGEARFSTRIRLERSQNVIALARNNQGEWMIGQQAIRVTVSGCLTRGQEQAEGPDFMRTRVRPPNPLRRGDTGEVRTLITHPMETGLRTNRAGETIPERIIHTFAATFGEETILEVKLQRAVAMNPFLLFPVSPPESGELTLTWTDTSGRTATDTAAITIR